jgi:chromosome segregation ATPase
MNEVRDVSLSEQLDPSTPAYINARLMELEQRFQEAPQELRDRREALAKATEKYLTAKAHAFLTADGPNKEAREAQAHIATAEAREGVRVAEAAFKYLQDRVHELSKELNALQTRSSNLRSEITIAGKGRP